MKNEHQTNPAITKKAKELYQQHKYDECLIELKSLASERPDNLIIQLYIATVKFAQNQYEDSIKSCHEIINQASLKNNYHVLYMAFLIIGNAYYYHENTAKAFGYYEKALDIVIDHPSIITDKDLYEIHIQKIEQIINDAVKTKLEPLQLAQLYMLANQNPSALTQLQQCNGSDYVRYLSMHIHCKSGNNKQAKRFIKNLKRI
ncbi:MAG: tetratricopeptide repeat protein [Coxiellaceae bacterium]|nr:MAG: tetratricopeptide repeat protein [Coxiellaceae bacterium]